MPTLTCNRCGKEDTLMVDAPHLSDPRVYCVECYAILFPPGYTDEDELTDFDGVQLPDFPDIDESAAL